MGRSSLKDGRPDPRGADLGKRGSHTCRSWGVVPGTPQCVWLGHLWAGLSWVASLSSLSLASFSMSLLFSSLPSPSSSPPLLSLSFCLLSPFLHSAFHNLSLSLSPVLRSHLSLSTSRTISNLSYTLCAACGCGGYASILSITAWVVLVVLVAVSSYMVYSVVTPQKKTPHICYIVL